MLHQESVPPQCLGTHDMSVNYSSAMCWEVLPKECAERLSKLVVQVLICLANLTSHRLAQGIKTLGVALLADFGIACSHGQVAARLLQPPQLKYKGTLVPPQDRGAWNLQGQQFNNPGTLVSFGVVSLNPPNMFQGDAGDPESLQARPCLSVDALCTARQPAGVCLHSGFRVYQQVCFKTSPEMFRWSTCRVKGRLRSHSLSTLGAFPS